MKSSAAPPEGEGLFDGLDLGPITTPPPSPPLASDPFPGYNFAAYAGGEPPAPTNPPSDKPVRISPYTRPVPTVATECPVTGEECDLQETKIGWRPVWTCPNCHFQTAYREEAAQRAPSKVQNEAPVVPAPALEPAPEPEPEPAPPDEPNT